MDSWQLNCLEANMSLTNVQSRRGLDLDLDLNYPLPPPMRALDLSLGLSSYGYINSEQVQATNAAAELHDDDEIAIISPRAFAQAKENSERNHSHGKRAMLNEATAMANVCTNCKARMQVDPQPCVKPETSNTKEGNVSRIQESNQPVPLPEESVFSCPVCIGPLIEPTSTKCGHIFCKECLQRSLKSLHNRCPTCRQKVGKRGVFRVYLPTIN